MIGVRHLLDDRSSLRFEIVYQRPSGLPVDEGSLPCDRAQPFSDLLRDFSGTLGASQFEPQPTLGGRATGADLDQQPGQSLGSQRLKVFRIECLLRIQPSSHLKNRSVDEDTRLSRRPN